MTISKPDTAYERESGSNLLQVEHLSISFPRAYGGLSVVDDISFDISVSESVGMVGESGSGKTLVALALLGMFPRGCSVTGRILYRGHNIVDMSERDRRLLRGSCIAMVYQDALTSLNPGLTIGRQLDQVMGLGSPYRPEELLGLVRIRQVQRVLGSYPHQLSGGQRQRILIAMALARDPDLIVADEPTTALDVTIESEIVDLLVRLQEERRFALLLISHDLALVAQLAGRMLVMYAGQLVEQGTVGELMKWPRHHYTAGLIAAALALYGSASQANPIPGSVPSPLEFPTGCRFRTRCPASTDRCLIEPSMAGLGTRRVACHHPVPTLVKTP